jgi:signal peptidase I
MYPTLQVGDRMLADRLPFSVHDLHTGDIVVFHRVPADTDPTQPAYLVKRVIGLPGQTISSRGGTVLIDNKPLREPWLPNLAKLPAKWLCNEAAENIPKTVIPPDRYFVMGDCRGNSYDSRAWGTVPASAVVGKVFAVIWRANHPWFHWF